MVEVHRRVVAPRQRPRLAPRVNHLGGCAVGSFQLPTRVRPGENASPEIVGVHPSFDQLLDVFSAPVPYGTVRDHLLTRVRGVGAGLVRLLGHRALHDGHDSLLFGSNIDQNVVGSCTLQAPEQRAGVELGNLEPKPGVHPLNLHVPPLVVCWHAHHEPAAFAVGDPRPHHRGFRQRVHRHQRDTRVATPKRGTHPPPVYRTRAFRDALVPEERGHPGQFRVHLPRAVHRPGEG
mmetsp:Transcript_12621/g.53299  ORF Transcript_12621/g.53299 Transcript_12621/m.53299 type:complete len:234 (-) Transcript_12621:1202-1903(-)